jgi:dihydroorotase
MLLLKNIQLNKKGAFFDTDILINDGKIVEIEKNLTMHDARCTIHDMQGCLAMPSACDVHVHLREPGFTHKEDVASGTAAAAKGGVTAVVAMPNTNPPIDTAEKINELLDIIKTKARVDVYPCCAITAGQKGKEIVDILKTDNRQPSTVNCFSDDGVGVNDLNVLKQAQLAVKKAGGIIASHAEAEGYGTSPEAEYLAIEREIELVRQTGVKYHFCHVSLEKSVKLIEKAQKEGLDVTCEVAPHHLFLNENDINNNANFKMNPPLRSKKDMLACQDGLLKGVISMVATDHAPHSYVEKAVAYNLAPNGIIGLETLIPTLYTNLVKTGRANMQDLINWVSINPRKRFNIPTNEIEVGQNASLTVLDVDTERAYTHEEILSKSKNSPFIGTKMTGFPVLTIHNGKIIYETNAVKN